jgi:DNA-binding response OmpR family regulator
MAPASRSAQDDSPLVLVADADKKAARRLADRLCQQGYNAAHTSLGRDVISLARSGRLRLAIVDVALQDMSGHILASRLRQIGSAISILMTSKDCRPELEIQARQMGILYYAQKPISHHRLEAVVAKALSGSHAPIKGTPRQR